jgi:hypothetical protein
MIPFEFKGEKFGIFFGHVETTPIDGGNGEKIKAFSGSECVIVRNPPEKIKDFNPVNGDMICAGRSKVHDADQFSRKKGRVIALTRALAEQPRDFRFHVWQTYWKALGKAALAEKLADHEKNNKKAAAK